MMSIKMAILSPRYLTRCFSVSSLRRLKEIVCSTSPDGKTITIEGINVPSARHKYLVDYDALQTHTHQPQENMLTLEEAPRKEVENKACPLCRLRLDVKHTDVLILQQFLDPSGNLLPKRVTGLCMKQHRRMDYLIQMAKLAGILKTPLDPEPTQRPGFMKYNKYYDESVIDEFLEGSRFKA